MTRQQPSRFDRVRQRIRGIVALVVAACIWAPCVHLVFRKPLDRYRSQEGLAPAARMLAARHLAIWRDAELRARELERMRQKNPEWDFMSRTYFVLALANMALRDREYLREACEIIDAIIENTIETEEKHGFEHFLLAYGRHGLWAVRPARSLFVDGEIALMLAARRMIEERESYKPLLAGRVEAMVAQMRRSPVLCGESYPNECWLFCNTMALASIRMTDVLDGTDHSPFLSSWVSTAQEKLIDPETGLLIATFTVDGTPVACGRTPEGSSLWMACHTLQIVDGAFAEDQYRRARKELGRSVFGFGYSREWPSGLTGSMDVDSGPVIPLFGASASASGLAIVAAAAFEDDRYLRRLLTSLEFGGFPEKRDEQLRFLASNPVGDAVLLYALTEGPLWTEVRRRMKP